MTAPARKAGGRWRLLAHRLDKGGRFFPGGMYGERIDIQGTDYGPNEFDEIVVGHWLHIEQMDAGRWWMNIGGVTIWLHADRDGNPKYVTVYGPRDYDQPVDGCKYECAWTDVP